MKNIFTYKNFLLEKSNGLSDSLKDHSNTDIMKKLFVDDPNNPLDKSINSVLERFNKKTDIYTKTEEGKEIYTAKMYRQLKAVDLNEIIIQKKNEYFIQKKKDGEDKDSEETQGSETQGSKTQDVSGQTNDSYNYNINEGFLKKMFDFAVKKTKLFAAKLKVSKKIDPIFDASKQEIEKLFENKELVESYEKANSDRDALVKKLEAESKELKSELETTTEALGDALNKNAQKEKGENAFKKGEIYTYQLENGNSERVVITKEDPVEFIRVSTNDKEKVLDNNPLKLKNIDKTPVTGIHKDKLSKIGDDNIEKIEKKYKHQIDYVKKIIQKEKK